VGASPKPYHPGRQEKGLSLKVGAAVSPVVGHMPSLRAETPVAEGGAKPQTSSGPTRLSVVIPVYDRQAQCERALRSVLGQNVKDMEIIVVDDFSASPFSLRADIATDPRIRVLRHDTNRGAGQARDTGVAGSRGEWIAFLDSDDYWLPGTLAPRLELAERAYAASADPMVAYAAGFVLERKSSGRNDARIPVASADLKDFLSGCWFAHGSTALLRREAFGRVGPADPGLRRLEDFDWFVRFVSMGGRLDVWPHIAAVIEVSGKPSAPAARAAIAHLRAKYLDPGSRSPLAPEMANQLEACFDFEMASILAAARRWLPTMFYLARSFWRVPRTTLYLRRLWARPVADESAGSERSATTR
jgi:GT2 family glycosyltransferase